MGNKGFRLVCSLLLLVGLIMIFFQGNGYAAPARPDSQLLKQPTGEAFYGTQHGDEWFNWTTADSGDVIIQDEKGYWNFAKLESGTLKPTGELYVEDKKSSSAVQHDTLVVWMKENQIVNKRKKSLTEEAHEYFRQQINQGAPLELPDDSWLNMNIDHAKHNTSSENEMRQNNVHHEEDHGHHHMLPQMTQEDLMNQMKATLPELKEESLLQELDEPSLHRVTGTKRLLVLLVEFNDIRMQYSDRMWYDRFFSNTEGSVKHYYQEVSGGKLNLAPAAEFAGTYHDGIVKVKLNYNHPNTRGWTGYANQQMVLDALAAADPYVDFASYDKNKDGRIDIADDFYLVTVIAGYEAAFSSATPSVWGHQWVAPTSRLDGVDVSGRYVQQGEVHEDHQATIGILVHELGHHFGLPDLYDTDGSSAGVGIHSVMAGGSWARYGDGYSGSSPTHPDAWSKVHLGWVTPYVIQREGYSYVTLNAALNNYNVLKITTDNPSEYFLFENRQFNGYDRGLQSAVIGRGGIAAWHIDESKATNADDHHRKVDLIESNEGILGYSQLDKNINFDLDHYYYPGHVNLLNNSSNPNTHQYNRKISGAGFLVHSESGNSMTVFAFKDRARPSTPTNLYVSNNSGSSISLQWTASYDSSGIQYYAIYRDGQQIGYSSSTSYTDHDVTAGVRYRYTVQAVDWPGNYSLHSNTVTYTP
ncbi:M6 family metalloprotease domain-containing protein [Caldalkalibacillus mannanilyticus]|uniref:M6 family metalloprotease domain-containing protein n=1 Tax=Caldalkalibacillus mannanilyticus TaxID=1418 RepID=UPI00046A4FAA|nr:M6 family metalloprotease domain-containing protein [Caldalkalibacillus mannanilyticus]